MVWWRGNGLWIGLLVAAGIASANKCLGPIGVAIACLASAAILFGVRGSLEDSSLFSIPTRFWWPVLLVLGILVLFKG
ncbi:hypothetical protein [Lysobacter enzymogenes]|uniref:hypothetical protein n=1 Tax=Lysobacter enzymogenes TaxID=69 RepID=UPI001A97CF20|nr:hypothetical protein [Lysobacter enzymogenes]QQP96720.1 hypothetical protein JHW38_01300 [Lysobacter enzymogenes]